MAVSTEQQDQRCALNYSIQLRLTGYILVAAHRSDDGRLIGQHNLVVGVRREKTLQESDGRVEDNSAFTASFDSHMNLAVVDEVSAHVVDVGRGVLVEVDRTEQATELVSLDLCRDEERQLLLRVGAARAHDVTSPKAVVLVRVAL